jgi:hypothetical protein
LFPHVSQRRPDPRRPQSLVVNHPRVHPPSPPFAASVVRARGITCLLIEGNTRGHCYDD